MYKMIVLGPQDKEDGEQESIIIRAKTWGQFMWLCKHWENRRFFRGFDGFQLPIVEIKTEIPNEEEQGILELINAFSKGK